MGKYEVVSGCYVPVGSGFRHKRSGQIVTLSDEDAASLGEHVKPVESSGESEREPAHNKPKRRGVAKRNTEPEAVEPEVVEQPVEPEAVEPEAVEPEAVEPHVVEEVVGEVSSDARYPQADHE